MQCVIAANRQTVAKYHQTGDWQRHNRLSGRNRDKANRGEEELDRADSHERLRNAFLSYFANIGRTPIFQNMTSVFSSDKYEGVKWMRQSGNIVRRGYLRKIFRERLAVEFKILC
jgi:hypothetical protein